MPFEKWFPTVRRPRPDAPVVSTESTNDDRLKALEDAVSQLIQRCQDLEEEVRELQVGVTRHPVVSRIVL